MCFSDFNREVIEEVTIPNVRLNVEERHWSLAEYYSGDWTSLSPLLEQVMDCDLTQPERVVSEGIAVMAVGGEILHDSCALKLLNIGELVTAPRSSSKC